MKTRQCKHEVGLKALANLHIFRQIAKNVPVGSRRHPGRPRSIPIRQSLQLDPFCLPIPAVADIDNPPPSSCLDSTDPTHISPVHSECRIASEADDMAEALLEVHFDPDTVCEGDEPDFHVGAAAFGLVSDEYVAQAMEHFRTLFG